ADRERLGQAVASSGLRGKDITWLQAEGRRLVVGRRDVTAEERLFAVDLVIGAPDDLPFILIESGAVEDLAACLVPRRREFCGDLQRDRVEQRRSKFIADERSSEVEIGGTAARRGYGRKVAGQ